MQSIGFEFNDNSNLIVQHFDVHVVRLFFIYIYIVKILLFQDSIVVPHEEEGNNVDHAVVDVQTPPKEVFIFDGDESKLYPGMRVKISTGEIYSLPSVPTYTTHVRFNNLIKLCNYYLFFRQKKLVNFKQMLEKHTERRLKNWLNVIINIIKLLLK